MTPDADPLLERPPDSPPNLRSSTSRSRLALFVCLIALGALAARLAESGRGQGLPWHGFVNGWLSLSIVVVATTVAARVGAEAGMRWGGRWWCVLLAATLGGIAAALGNALLGAVWGLVIGCLRIPGSPLRTVWIGGLRLSTALLYGLRAAARVVLPAMGACLIGTAAGFLLLRRPWGEVLLATGVVLVTCWQVRTLRPRGKPLPADSRRLVWRVFMMVSCLLAILASSVGGRWLGVRTRLWMLRPDTIRVYEEDSRWLVKDHSLFRFDDGSWKDFWNGPVVTALRMENSSDWELDTLRFLRRDLDAVQLQGDMWDDRRVAELPDVSNSAILDILSARFTGDNVPRQLEMTALQGLGIVDTPVHDAGLLAIANKAAAAGTLDVLVLSKTEISAAGWSQLLARNKRVGWRVAVEDPSLTDTDLAAISKLPMIELNLNCPKVTGVGLTQLRETPQLRRLNLTVLELDGPSIEVLTELLQQGVSIELRLARGESLHFATAEFMAASSLQLSLWVGGDALTPEDVRVLACARQGWVRVSDPANLPKFAGIPLSGILIGTLRAGDTPFLDGLACDSLLIEDYGNEWRLTEELASRRLSEGVEIYPGNRWSRELFGNFEIRDSWMHATADVPRSIH